MKSTTEYSRYYSLLVGASVWGSVLLLSGSLLSLQAASSPKGKADAKKAAAKAGGEGEESSQAAAPAKMAPLVIARPDEVSEKSLSGAYHFYVGTLHSHSVYSGDVAKSVATKYNHGVATYDIHTPAEVLARAKTNFFDFYFLTEHSSPEQNEFYKNGMTDAHWKATERQIEAATTPTFLPMRGYEFSRNSDPDHGGLGHMNVLNSPTWNSAYAPGHTFTWLYDWMGRQTNAIVLAQFNHPAMPGQDKAKNFNNYQGRTKARNEEVRVAEIWNSGENMGYVPVVKKIWALGWKVAPTANNDSHGPLGLENRRLRTGVLAERLAPDAIMRALKDRRVYATLEPALHLEFTLNGAMMGTALDQRPPGDLKAKVFVNDPAGATLSKVEVIGANYDSNGGATKVLASLAVGRTTKLVEGAVPNGYDFYYAAVYKEGVDTPRAFAAPVWMDNN